MKNKIILLALGFLSFSLSLSAQKKKATKADKKYENLAYVDAIAIYEKVVKKGYTDAELLKKLGNSYYYNSDYVNAEKWYGLLFTNTNASIEPEYYYKYAQTLKSLKNYDKANEYLEKFSKLQPNDFRAKLFIDKGKIYLAEIKRNSGRYDIKDAGINSEYSDFGGTFYENIFVFSSNRSKRKPAKRIHTWMQQEFLDFHSANIDGDGNLIYQGEFLKDLNSEMHESTAVFTQDGKTVYFTRNNYLKKQKTDNKGTTLLKLYRATKEDGKWGNVEELPFNSDEYSVAHPTLSLDDNILYFSSDMPGTLGKSDIFKVTINSDGSFGTPENLGTPINTEGRETFPFISDENELYFSSDGHLGLGGLDVFVLSLSEENSNVHNLGKPLNSQFDDFCYIIDSASRKGFFSSNREGGLGYDDIYTFIETAPLPHNCKQVLSGVVIDEDTKEPLVITPVILYDSEMNELQNTQTDNKGKYSFTGLECEGNYIVRTMPKDYEVGEKAIITAKKTGEITDVSFQVEKLIKEVTVGTDLAQVFNIENIYFDLDKSDIRFDAALDLAKIVEVMKENPTMKIDVRSHTDSRATHQYNQKLSDKRAKSTINWMIANGITADRLTGKGYGETQLVNKCADGVECTEEAHQQNRRSEFIIISM